MPNKKEFEFDKQKKVGDRGEKLLLKYYPKCQQDDGIITDFKMGDERVELKTDTWAMDETKNFFMEYYSDSAREKPGGPFQAEINNIDWFVYLYIKNKAFYWFRTKELVAFLREYIKDLKYKTVKNKAWITTGYAVPREAIEHLAIKIDNFGENEPF